MSPPPKNGSPARGRIADTNVGVREPRASATKSLRDIPALRPMTPTSVRAQTFRPHPGLACAATVFFGVLPVGFLIWLWRQPQKEPGDFAAMIGMTLFFAVCSLVMVGAGWYATLQTLMLTDEGIAWKGFRRGWTADWKDVIDLGWRTNAKQGQVLCLITEKGRVSMTRGLWGGKSVERIAEAVAERAPYSPPLGEIGLRPTDSGPQVFEFGNGARGMKAFLIVGGAFLSSMMLGGSIRRMVEIPMRGPIEGWECGAMGMSLLLLVCMGAIGRAIWRNVAGQARIRSLTLTEETLAALWRDGRTAAIPWSAVSHLNFELSGWRLTTPEGDVVFGTLTPNYATLLQLVRERTGLTGDDEPASPRPDARGVRVWRYSTMYSALLWLPLGLGGMIVGQPYIARFFGFEFEQKGDDPTPIFALVLLASIWGMWRRKVGFVETDEQGISVHGLTTKGLRWSEIETRRVGGSDFMRFCRLSGRGITLRLWLSGLDEKALLAEIEERTAHRER